MLGCCETFEFQIHARKKMSTTKRMFQKPNLKNNSENTHVGRRQYQLINPKTKSQTTPSLKQAHSLSLLSRSTFSPPFLLCFPLPHLLHPPNPQLRLLRPPQHSMLLTRLTNLVQRDPFALNDPSIETLVVGVVACKMAVFDQAATGVAAVEVDDFELCERK